jgi:7,8-dihydroneopterin 2',3'-cyclic phosphate phosphodiesterase
MKTTLNDLLELAGKIKDVELRRKVIEILKHPSLTNKKFKYQPVQLKDAPASTQWHHTQVGGLVQHTYSVTSMSIEMAKIIEKVYGLPLNKDSLVAAALVHDIAKLWGISQKKGVFASSKITIDHTILGSAELYARGFPESVIHIVASHFGDQGPTPPQTIEAILFHYIDSLDAMIGTSSQSAQNLLYLLG